MTMSCGWLWLYAGAFMMLMELLTPGFVMFFFGLSAATVGLLRLALGGAMPLLWQTIAFSVFSVVYLLFLRRWVKAVFFGKSGKRPGDLDDGFAGRTGRVTVAINPPLSGRVIIGDAEWTAVSDSPIGVGADVKVVSQDNLTVKVEAI